MGVAVGLDFRVEADASLQHFQRQEKPFSDSESDEGLYDGMFDTSWRGEEQLQ